MSDENKNTNNQPDNNSDKQDSPKIPLLDPKFLVGVLSGLLVLILALVIGNKLANTNYQIDVSSQGFLLGLILIANYTADYAPILGIIGIVFSVIGLKIKTKFLQILNCIIIAIAFLELLLLCNI